jgi:hypothetical protein
MRDQLLKHASVRKIAVHVTKDCQEMYDGLWKFHAVERLRRIAGISIENAQTIISEMSDN